MGYYFGKQDMQNLSRAQERCVLLTNGLGICFGYSCLFGQSLRSGHSGWSGERAQ